MGTHGCAFDLEEMLRIEGEIVVGKNKLCELEEEMSGWLGLGRALIKEMFQGREGMGDVSVYGGDINSGYDGVRWERGGMGRDRITSRKWLVSWTWQWYEVGALADFEVVEVHRHSDTILGCNHSVFLWTHCISPFFLI